MARVCQGTYVAGESLFPAAAADQKHSRTWRNIEDCLVERKCIKNTGRVKKCVVCHLPSCEPGLILAFGPGNDHLPTVEHKSSGLGVLDPHNTRSEAFGIVFRVSGPLSD